MSRRRRRKSGGGGGSDWLPTYADLITNLFAFFVLLFAFSTVDQAKFATFMHSIQNTLTGSMSVMSGGESFRVDPAVEHKMESDSLWDNYGIELEPLKDVLDKMQVLIEGNEIAGGISVYLEGRGLVIRITDDMLFDSGKAEIREAAKSYLADIARVVSEIDNPIQVEGHTDNIPIATTRFPSNWELSSARALNVLHFLVDQGIDPNRLSATAYGEHKPLYPNDTPELRARNRRVEIVLLRKGMQDDTLNIYGESVTQETVDDVDESADATASTTSDQSESEAVDDDIE